MKSGSGVGKQEDIPNRGTLGNIAVALFPMALYASHNAPPLPGKSKGGKKDCKFINLAEFK